jgi:hypothetical protein
VPLAHGSGLPQVARDRYLLHRRLWPGLGDLDQLRLVRDMTVDVAEYDGYDRDRWPVWREWAAGAARSPSRTLAVERLRLLGVATGR